MGGGNSPFFWRCQMLHITESEFEKLTAFIHTHTGIHLKNEKKALLVGRLNNLLSELKMTNFTDYYNQLVHDESGRALSILIDKITTNHTYFMREAKHFDYLAGTVLPYLKETVKQGDLRIWCAASSSGEEPYTIAMIIDEFTRREKVIWNKKILATDLSLSILEQAKAGRYNKEKIEVLPRMWVLNYFQKIDQTTYVVKDGLKQEVIFRRFNLLEPVFNFKKKFHAIFCRNVMIYFDGPTKEVLIDKLYDQLEYGGYLFIGHSESINREKTKFRYIQPAVYRKL